MLGFARSVQSVYLHKLLFHVQLNKMLVDDFTELRMCSSSVFHMSSMTFVQLSYLRDLTY